MHRTRRVLHAAEQHRAQERDDQKGGGWMAGTSDDASHDMMVWGPASRGKCRAASERHQGMRMPGMCSCPSGCFGLGAGLGAGFAGAFRAGFSAAGAGFAAVESRPTAGAGWSVAL